MAALPDELAGICRELGVVGAPTALDGGITNHNFRVELEDGRSVVLRVCGKDTDQLGIDRDAERVATHAASDLGIAPEVVAYVESCTCLVTAFVPGDPVSEEQLREPGVLGSVASSLRRFHDSEVQLPTRFEVPNLAREYAHRSGAEGRADVHDAIVTADAIAAIVGEEAVPCHNDLLAANFIQTTSGASIRGVKPPENVPGIPKSKVVLLDWEYAGMGSRYFDLGNLSINNGFTETNDRALLAAYGLDGDEHFMKLRLMRAMSDIREALWGVIQEVVSEIEFDFVAYANEHFDRLGKTLAEPQISEWMADGKTA